MAGGFKAGGLALARGITLSGSDWYLRESGLMEPEDLRGYQEEHPGISIGGEVLGAIVPSAFSGGSTAGVSGAKVGGSLARRALMKSPAALADRAGIALGKAAGGGLRGATVRGVAEGGIGGLAVGASELAMTEDIDVEKAVSVLGSNMLYGAGAGAGLSVFASAAGKGINKARKMVNESMEARKAAAGVSDDLAKMDVKGLHSAKRQAIKDARDDLIRERRTMADEMGDYFRRTSDDTAYVWKATDWAANSKAKENLHHAKLWSANKKFRKAIENQLDNVDAMATHPSGALKALKGEAQQLETLIARTDEITDSLGRQGMSISQIAERTELLKKAPGQLAENRRLQAKIQSSLDAWEVENLVSPRLDDVNEALATFSDRSKKGFLQRSAESVMTGAGTVALAPFMGFAAGGLTAAKGAETISGLVFGRLGKATAESSARIASAVDKFVGAAGKVPSKSPGPAARVLTRLRYSDQEQDDKPRRGQDKTVAAYKARAKEIRSQVEPGPDGSLTMRPAARQRIADKLAGLRALNPIAADRMETVAARKIGFLASKLPKRPDVATLGQMVTVDDNWRPSDMEIAEFARIAAALEDPASLAERLVDGSLVPEEAEALREVFPEIYADIQAQVIAALPRLRKSLPYHRRLALSIFTGVPVDPGFHPDVFRILQRSFENEMGTEGGTQPSAPQPQFGSVARPEPTPAQERMS